MPPFFPFVCSDEDADLSRLREVLRSRQSRAEGRIQAYDLVCNCLANLHFPYTLRTLLKTLRSLGREVPSLQPVASVPFSTFLNVSPNPSTTGSGLGQQEVLQLQRYRNACWGFLRPYEYGGGGEKGGGLDWHYADNIRGCGRKTERQLLKSFYRTVAVIVGAMKRGPTRPDVHTIPLPATAPLSHTEASPSPSPPPPPEDAGDSPDFRCVSGGASGGGDSRASSLGVQHGLEMTGVGVGHHHGEWPLWPVCVERTALSALATFSWRETDHKAGK